MGSAPQLDYRDLLKDVFASRQKQNSRYSLRAFARDLDLSPSALSDVLRGKRGISLETARAISTRLNLPKDTRVLFHDLVEAKNGRTVHARTQAKRRLRRIDFDTLAPLREDILKALSDWHHYAILELVGTIGFEPSVAWIARRLRLDEQTIQLGVDRLIRVGMLEIKDGEWFDVQSAATTTDQIPSSTVRELHRQILSKASDALETQGIERRQSTSIVFAADPESIDKVKALINRFKEELSQVLSDQKNKSTVYAFTTQLFDLTDGKSEGRSEDHSKDPS